MTYSYLKIWVVLQLIVLQTVIADLLIPEDGANLQYIHIAFEWEQEGDAVEYQLHVAFEDDPEFENIVIDLTDQSLISIVTGNLNWETSYLWRVRPVYADGAAGSWIDTNSFTILSYMNIAISTEIHDPENYYPGFNLFGSPGPSQKSSWIIDMVGNVIWAADTIPFNPLSNFLPNGNLMGIYFFLGEGLPSYDSKIAIEYSIDNEIIWSTPDSLLVHHDMIKLSNGNYMVITNESQNGPIPLGSWTSDYVAAGFEADGVTIEFPWEGDRIVELDPESGEVVWSWSVFDHYSMDDFDSLGGGWNTAIEFFKFDWTHCNSISFDEEENTILLSSRHLSRITKIDYETGEIIWNMGRQLSSGEVDFGTELCFSYQHHITKLDNGNLLFLDNGNNSPNYCGTDFPTTRALEIEIFEIDGTNSAEIVWEHVLPNNLAGRFMGSCERLPNGNTLFTPGGITPGIIGKAFEVSSTNEVVWEMEITTISNRIFRIPGLYQQKFSIVQPNWAWYYPDPWIFLPLGDNTVTYTINNEGTVSETYEYEFQDNGLWFEDVSGTVEILPGNSTELNFSGSVFNEMYPHTLTLSVIPVHAPNLTKSVEIDAWSTTLSIENEEIPTKVSVNPAYPNPFNSSTIIEYYLPDPAEVEITVFNLTGREVEQFVSNWVNSGNHRFIWSPENLAAGIYVIQYKISESVENIEKVYTQKLIYMK